MGRTSQRKGRAGELEICRIFQSYGIPAEPGQAASYGSTPDITGVDGIHCKIKRSEQFRLSEWLARAERDAVRFGDGVPTVFHRSNRRPWTVTMLLSDWMSLYKRAETAGNGLQKEVID